MFLQYWHLCYSKSAIKHWASSHKEIISLVCLTVYYDDKNALPEVPSVTFSCHAMNLWQEATSLFKKMVNFGELKLHPLCALAKVPKRRCDELHIRKCINQRTTQTKSQVDCLLLKLSHANLPMRGVSL